jgi:hypothetical protein
MKKVFNRFHFVLIALAGLDESSPIPTHQLSAQENRPEIRMSGTHDGFG